MVNCSHFNPADEAKIVLSRASPRLKDASLPAESLTSLYSELLLTVRKMFHVCRLVHADLSEYNILYHDGHLWIIDVSQSVEHDHPSAFDFLRNDLKNVDQFFGRLGVKCLGLRKSFDFVTRESISPVGENLGDAEALEKWLEQHASENGDIASESIPDPGRESKTEDSHHEDSVFLKSFIPRTLYEVHDPERDLEMLAKGEGQGLLYANSIGVIPSVTPTTQANGPASRLRVSFRTDGMGKEDEGGSTVTDAAAPNGELQEEQGEAIIESGQETDSEEDNEGEAGEHISKEEFVERKPRGHRHEDKEAKKVSIVSSWNGSHSSSLCFLLQDRKKQVKEENKERRKQKMPKAEKKRLIKKTSNKPK